MTRCRPGWSALGEPRLFALDDDGGRHMVPVRDRIHGVAARNRDGVPPSQLQVPMAARVDRGASSRLPRLSSQ